MASSGSTAERAAAAAEATRQALPAEDGFGAEFRELARQRRFVRSDRPAEPAPAATPDQQVEDWRRRAAEATARAGSWRAAAAAPSSAAPSPTVPEAHAPVTASATAAAPAPSSPTAPAPTAPALDPRISEDHPAMLRELARMSDRLVQSREQLAATTTRVAQLTNELQAARAELLASDERLLASRVLVQDAQRATHELAERCARLEGRCEMLGEALELAVNASWLTRWRWRREHRARVTG